MSWFIEEDDSTVCVLIVHSTRTLALGGDLYRYMLRDGCGSVLERVVVYELRVIFGT